MARKRLKEIVVEGTFTLKVRNLATMELVDNTGTGGGRNDYADWGPYSWEDAEEALYTLVYKKVKEALGERFVGLEWDFGDMVEVVEDKGV